MELLTMNRFEKAAIEVIQPFVKNKITHIIPDKSKNSVLSLDEAKTLAEAMDASARYGALNDTQVHLNGAKITGFQNRAVENKRNTGWTKMMAGMSDPFANMPDKSKNVPDAFFPNHDAVWLPSGNPGIMMHELGHAADMNEFPNTPFRRFVAGTYQNFSPTLWKEHAAWIKGKNRLIEGAAKTKVDPNLVVRTLEDAARVKPVGLGSYWGGGLGALAGGGLGLAAVLNRVAPPQAAGLGLLLGGAAGAFTGLQLGKMYGNSDRLGSEKAKQSYLDLYANQYAKEHGITLDKAKIELNNFIKAKKKPSTIRKAASFGSMFGRKFTPDRNLQQALLAERDKLVDDWYNGDMEDYDTHPDMGGNPDFDRRWNKAFNNKEEVEPRVIKGIPYPLYGSKPSWFPFRTQGMIDKAREEEYVRGDNEEAWDDNDFKTERALRDDHTREGVNNILNHYLDRNHGIVKNPYRHPADLEDLEGRHVDYKGMVQKSVPWKPSTDIDNINALFEETQIGDYKPTANRQKLFDQYYPYLDLAPSAKPSKKGPIAKAAAFGRMMGKIAFYKKAGNPTLDFYRKQQEQEIASARAQAAALRGAAGVTGSGGGTTTGRVFPDGKGGYRTEGAQFTPQAGYDQKGFKIQPSGAQGTPAAKPRYSSRNDPAFKEDFEDIAADKANMNKLQNATGNAGNGSYQGTIQGGKVNPGATFTPNAGQQGQSPLSGATFTPKGGQQGQSPLPRAGGQANTPPVPRGAQPAPKSVPTNKTIPNRRVILDN